MSLRVWLPLNGNTTNQGVDGITLSGSPASYSAGKIGTAATWNGSVGNVVYNNTTAYNYTDNFSFCIWVYPIYTGSTAQYAFTVGRADAGGYGYGLQVGSSSEVTVRFGNKGINVSCASNTWSHIAMVVKGSSIYIYKNGILYTTTAVGSLPTYSDGNGLGLGCFHYSGNIYPYYGRINDFRIYDHALSDKEVKEISKGLVVHYPMTGGGRGQDNLGDFQSVANKWTNDGMSSLANYADSEHGNVLKMTNSSANVRIYRGVSNVWKSGQSYTVSFLAKSATAGTVVNMSRSLGDFSSNFTLTTSWKKYVGIINSTVTADGGTLSFRIVSANAEVYLTNIKLENGTICTSYIPGSSDPNYSTMGYGDNKEYDISGYKYHGTKSGVTYKNDSPRYDICTLYSNNTHITSTIDASGFANSYTFSWWGKYTNYSSHMMWGYSNGNRLNLYMSSGNFYWNTGDGNNNPFSVSAATYGDGNWHHFAITGDGTTAKLYIDGIFKANASTYKGITGTSLVFNGWATSADYNFNGSLSDFRLYSTPLSADDIKELYQTSASIADNGSILCYDFEEV